MIWAPQYFTILATGFDPERGHYRTYKSDRSEKLRTIYLNEVNESGKDLREFLVEEFKKPSLYYNARTGKNT